MKISCTVDRQTSATGGSVFISVGPPPMPRPQPGRRTPGAFAFALDDSVSMDDLFAPGAPSRREMVDRGMAKMAAVLDPDSLVSVVRFASGAEVVFRGTAAELAARPQIDPPKSDIGSATNFEAALTTCAGQLQGHTGARRIVMLTDGDATEGLREPAQLAAFGRQLAEQGIHIDALGIGSDSRDSLLSSLVGDTGQTAHVEATHSGAAEFEQTCEHLVKWAHRAHVQGGFIRLLIHPAWKVGTVLRTHPQERAVTDCTSSTQGGGTLVSLPLGAFGTGGWRPAFVVELTAPRHAHPARQVVQAYGEVILEGRHQALDGSDAGKIMLEVVPEDGMSGYLQHDPALGRLVAGARLMEDIDAKVSRSPEHLASDFYQQGVTRARERGLHALADDFQNALNTLGAGGQAADVQSATRARATRARTPVSDVLGETRPSATRKRRTTHQRGA